MVLTAPEVAPTATPWHHKPDPGNPEPGKYYDRPAVGATARATGGDTAIATATAREIGWVGCVCSRGGVVGVSSIRNVSGRYYSKFYLYHLVSKDIRGSYNNSVPISG